MDRILTATTNLNLEMKKYLSDISKFKADIRTAVWQKRY